MVTAGLSIYLHYVFQYVLYVLFILAVKGHPASQGPGRRYLSRMGSIVLLAESGSFH
jgi:hypothetical protein